MKKLLICMSLIFAMQMRAERDYAKEFFEFSNKKAEKLNPKKETFIANNPSLDAFMSRYGIGLAHLVFILAISAVSKPSTEGKSA